MQYFPATLLFGSSGMVFFTNGGQEGQAFEIKYTCPPPCIDKKSERKCKKALKKGKCHKKKFKNKCAKTCGHC